MADFAATDVTVSLSSRHIEHQRGMLRRVFADLTFGDASLTYAVGGIPLPAKEQFGFKKEIVFGAMEQPSGDYVYKYARSTHKLLIYQGGSPTNPPTQTDLVEITGAAPSEKTVRMMLVGE